MGSTLFRMLLLTFIVVAMVPADDATSATPNIPSGTYKYLEGSSGQTYPFLWHITYPGELVEIKVDTAEYKTVNRCRKSGETVFWSAEKKDGSEVSAVRNNHELIVTQVERGKQSVKNHKIDNRPWFQPISYSLHDFLRSDEEQIAFWSIRMDTNKPVLLKAQKIGADYLTLENQTVPATKVEIRLAGPLSMFWHGTYWYRQQDGLFLQYKSEAGPAKSLNKQFVLVGKIDS